MAAAIDGVLRQQGSPSDLPTMVLEAGGGGGGECWAFLQEYLARRGLVVSYDRAGFGRNTEWADDLGAPGVAARLDALLTRAAIPPPYLLVGHSLGGLFVQYYAATHPEKIAGLVLVDPTNCSWRSAAVRQHVRRGYRAMPHSRRFLILPFQILRWRIWNWGIRALAATRLLRLWNPFSASTRELAAIGVSQKLVARHPIVPDVPMLVVSSGGAFASVATGSQLPAYHGHFLAGLLQYHKDVAARSECGRHVLFAEADHNSLLNNPEHATKLAELTLEFAETYCRRRCGWPTG